MDAQQIRWLMKNILRLSLYWRNQDLRENMYSGFAGISFGSSELKDCLFDRHADESASKLVTADIHRVLYWDHISSLI